MREIKVEEYLRDRVTELGGYCRKVVFPGFRGAPDRLIGWPNSVALNIVCGHAPLHLFVEMKRPGGPGATGQQEREHKRLRAIGFIVEVAHTREEVDRIIAQYGPPVNV